MLIVNKMETNEIGEEKLKTENTKKKKLSDIEEATLIQCIIEREGNSFGDIKFKGIGLKKKSVTRGAGWDVLRCHQLVSTNHMFL